MQDARPAGNHRRGGGLDPCRRAGKGPEEAGEGRIRVRRQLGGHPHARGNLAPPGCGQGGAKAPHGPQQKRPGRLGRAHVPAARNSGSRRPAWCPETCAGGHGERHFGRGPSRLHPLAAGPACPLFPSSDGIFRNVFQGFATVCRRFRAHQRHALGKRRAGRFHLSHRQKLRRGTSALCRRFRKTASTRCRTGISS